MYVHGLWMLGPEAHWLRQRLAQRCGYRLHVFRYRSVHDPVAQIVGSLYEALAALDAPRVHLLGHSLGGLIILRCLERHALARPGRIVLLGAPVRGSRAARALARAALGRRLLGRAAREELLVEHQRRWDGQRALGIIAGNWPFGLGQLLAHFEEENDGVVAVSETRLEGASAQLTLPVSHSGLLVSRRAALEIASFLEHGRFGSFA